MLGLSFKIFTHYLLSRRAGAIIRAVAWMAMTAIAVGVAALVIVVSVMNGFNAVIRQRHLKAEPHLVITAPDGAAASWQVETVKRVESVLGTSLEEITPYVRQDVIIKTIDGFFAGAEAKGVNQSALQKMVQRLRQEKQRSSSVDVQEVEPQPEEWVQGRDEILMGEELAAALRLVPGDRVMLIAPEALLLPADEAPPMKTVTMRGTFYSALADVDGRQLLFDPTRSLKELRGMASQSLGVEVRLIDPGQYEPAAALLRAQGFRVETWPERNAAMFFALKLEKLAMTVFLGLSALITSFSILTVLILLVTQKRRDIGILMAMGLNSLATRRVFTQVGIWMTGAGVSVGLALGVLVCWIVDTFPLSVLPKIYYDRTIPADVSGTMLAVIAVVAVLLSAVGSWFPAYLSVRGTPAEALRGPIVG